jgi:hypothetical protein
VESPQASNESLRQTQKACLWYLILFSLLIDFIWIVYWSIFWNREDFVANNYTRLTSLTLVVSVVNFLLKVPIWIIKLVALIWLFVKETECKWAVQNFEPNLKSFFIYTPEQEVM